MFLVTLGGIFVISTLIGVLNNALEVKLGELRKGRSLVIEADHTLILGWSPQIFTIIAELVIANEHRERSCIVVLGEKDKVEMEDEIREKIPNTRTTHVVCRSGNPIDMDDLRIVRPETAAAIIVLPPEGKNPDAVVLKILMAITKTPRPKDRPHHVVAQIHDPKNMEVARMVGKGEVELIQISDLISRIIAQTCRQSGLSIVYAELLGYEGDEMYLQEEPDLVGKQFGQTLFAYEDSSVIGLMPAKTGVPVVNPPMDTVIQKGDKIIAISENFDTVILSGKASYPIDESMISLQDPAPPTPEQTLILGWNWRVPAVIQELDSYVAPGSEVTVVSTYSQGQRDITHRCQSLRNQEVTYRIADTTDRRVLDSLDVHRFKHIILVCYSDQMDPQEADSLTLMTLLHLRDIADQKGAPLSVVSEMLDQRNRSLAEVAQADDFIVSNQFISLIVTQVSQSKHLNAVFADLFDADGSEIYLKLARDYVKLGTPLNFYTVLAAAQKKSEIAIGYHLKSAGLGADKAYGVVINPEKSAEVVFQEWDRIVVVAED